MRRTFIGLVAAILLFAIGCGDDDDDSGGLLGNGGTENTENNEGGDSGENSTGGDGYSDEVRNNYMNACTVQGNQSYCQCTWDYIVENIPFDEYVAFEEALLEDPSAEPPQAFVDATVECANA